MSLTVKRIGNAERSESVEDLTAEIQSYPPSLLVTGQAACEQLPCSLSCSASTTSLTAKPIIYEDISFLHTFEAA
jgi:hypothetical protein